MALYYDFSRDRKHPFHVYYITQFGLFEWWASSDSEEEANTLAENGSKSPAFFAVTVWQLNPLKGRKEAYQWRRTYRNGFKISENSTPPGLQPRYPVHWPIYPRIP